MKPISSDSTIADLVEESIRIRPGDSALSCEDRSLSYSELGEQADRVAIALRAAGVRPETLVAVCGARDIELVVALLGVLKAGGAYLPLDPAYPKDRLSFMISDSRASLVLVEREFGHLIPECGLVTLYIDDLLTSPAESLPAALPAAEAGNLAYVIYTSGSTGRPKGVEICHRNVAALFASAQAWGEFSHDDVWTLFHSISFDFSVWELWGALIYGSRLVIVPFEISRSPSEFGGLLERERVTVLNQTPSAFRQLVSAVADQGRVGPWLRLVIFGGEPLDRSMLVPWYELLPGDGGPALVNMYGITEATVHVTHLRLTRTESVASKSIGRPLSSVRLHVLDESVSPVMPGEVGEIYVGGSGVARGYRRRPTLTAERFVADRFSGAATARLYRTGDLGRVLRDGSIEYLGRADSQVKIRGYRIEPGEIECVLREHAGVRDAAVTVTEDRIRGRRLIAFVSANGVGGSEVPDGTVMLPSGRRAYTLNEAETNFMIREIFTERIYMRSGIKLPDGACILDVGANIGLFSIFILDECHNPEILAFEPIRPVYDILQQNFKLNKIRGKVFPYALGAVEDTARFSYYPNASVLSGRFAGQDDMLAVKSFMLNQLGSMGRAGKGVDGEMVADLLNERLRMVPCKCRMRPLSDVLAAEGIDHVDLLKVDVEKSEADVLAGISPRDFRKIDQIVVEVHDLEGRLSQVVASLRNAGYEISVQQDSALETTPLYNVYARRKRRRGAAGRSGQRSGLAADNLHRPDTRQAVAIDAGVRLVADLRLFALERLPDFMVPAAIVVLDHLPLTANGKLDRAALLVPDSFLPGSTVSYTAPRTDTEAALASLWAQTLGVARIGIDDSFFDLGGDSILGLELLARIRATMGIRVPARVLFDAPTVAQFALMATCGTVPGEDAIPAADRTVALPLSSGQQRFWFLQEFDPRSSEYNLPFAYRLRGQLDLGTLQIAFSRLAARHEPLRTTFADADGRGEQVIHPPGTVPVVLTDMSGLTETARRAAVARFLRDEPARPFDLHSGPPLRVHALRLCQEEHLLLIVMHHAATDGWSMGILATELSDLYSAARQGRVVRFAPLAIQYADFAVWQQRRLSGGLLDGQVAYWRHKLSGLVPLELPADYPRPVVRGSQGDEHGITVPSDIVAGLRRLGREQHATLFMVLVAACQLLLSRYCGQDDVAVGTVSSGRERVELRNLIGFFVNTVILRDFVNPELTFRQFLDIVRTTVLDAFANDEVPFERLVEELCPVRDPGRMPLVQVLIILQNAPATPLRISGCRVSEVSLPRSSAVFDIVVEFFEVGEKLNVRIAYSTALFAAPAIERMAGHLLVTLSRVIAKPDCPMARLPVLTEMELNQMAPSQGQTAADCMTMVELFQQQAARASEEIAVTHGDSILTYGDLADRSTRLASYLRTLGVGPETLVPICADRGPEMITGILAILQAGGAYVPLPPEYPQDRLARMLAETGADVLVTQSWHRSRIEAALRARVDLDTFDYGGYPPAEEVRRSSGPDALAYVIYTSGSTGLPKGVMMTHRSLLNVARAKIALLSIVSQDRVLQFASSGFDVSVTEIFVALAAGARLCIADRWGEDDLLGELRTRQVTVATLPTALLSVLTPGELPALRVVEACGEACPARVVDTWARNRTFFNGYGVTESICATMSRCRVDAPTAPSIGKPLPNVVAYVLDASLNIMPTGATGELYLGGVQLARGYLGQPRMTAERFVASPFGRPGSRMYRTGDLVRGLPSGEFEFVGRTDDQVKIRGFRIELAEIESALRRHPDVREARVVMVRDGMRDRLVAYTVPRSGHSAALSAGVLRKHLLRLLPDHMVPAEFVALDALPLTHNGKLDKAALPMPRRPLAGGRRSYTAPRNDLEAALVRIWEDALGADRIGVTDNFFDVGGDSILSMQVVSLARRAGLDLSPRLMFMCQTIVALAEELAGARPCGDERRLQGDPGRVPLAPAQRRLFQASAGSWDVWQSMLLEFDLSADRQALRAALAALLSHHGALGTRFEEVDGKWLQHGEPVDLESVLLVVDEPVGGQLGASAPDEPPDRQAPPVQILLLGVPGGMRLLFRAREFVVDDFSWRILLQDLMHGYRQAAAGGPPDLGQPTATFWEWSARLADDVLTGLFDDELEHWQETEQRALGTPRVNSANRVGRQPAVALTQWLDAPRTAALTTLLPGRLMARVDEVLIAAVAMVLSESSRSGRVCVGIADSNREYPSGDLCTDRTVGCFTATYPCVLEIPHSAALGAVVAAIRRQLRNVPRRGLGYTALGRTEPAPDVVFSYAGEFGKDLSRYGVRILRAPGPDPDRQRRGPFGGLEIRSCVVHGRLQIVWAYPPDQCARKAVEALAHEYMRVLGDLASLGLSA